MKRIVVLGATGNSGSLVAETLLKRGGCIVRVVGRAAARMERFARMGAEVFEGSVKDADAMTRAFKDASAAYTMVPPDRPAQIGHRPVSPVPASADHYAEVTRVLAGAIAASDVRQVVNLSALHAHLPERSTYLADFFRWEKALDAVPGINVTHLRPGFFMEGLYDWIPMIQSENRTTNLFPPDMALPFIAARDVGAAASEELGAPRQGIVRRELLGQRDLTMREATAIIGEALGMPQLRYVQLSFDEAVDELLRRNASKEAAFRRYEMRAGVVDGSIRPEESRTPENTTPTSFEWFVEHNFLPTFAKRTLVAEKA